MTRGTTDGQRRRRGGTDGRWNEQDWGTPRNGGKNMNTKSSLAHRLRLRCILSINKSLKRSPLTRIRWIGVDGKIGLLETSLMPFFAGLIDANDSAKSDTGGKELCAHAMRETDGRRGEGVGKRASHFIRWR